MKVVSTFHPSTAVSHSLKCSLTLDEGVEHLVVAHSNRIDVFLCQPTGLEHKTSFDIWGRVIALRALPIEGCRRSNLLVMTDHPSPELIFLTYSLSSKTGLMTFTTTRNLSLYDRSARQAEYLNDVLVDPSGRIAVASCHTGKLKLVHLKGGEYDRDFDLPVPELNILSIAFLSFANDSLSLAILHRDHREQICLLSRDIKVADTELPSSPSTLLPSTVVSAKSLLLSDSPPFLIHVPSTSDGLRSLGGVLLFGGRKILFFQFANSDSQKKLKGKYNRTERRKKSTDLAEVQKAKQKELERESRKRKPAAMIEWPWSEVTAWCTIAQDGDSHRYLLGDLFGRLALLSFNTQELALILLPLAEVSPPSTITYLTTQIVYLGSHFGDSQLLRIHSSPTDNRMLLIPPDIPVTAPARINTSLSQDDDEFETEISTGKVIESTGNYVTVLQTFKNIAPIVDAVLADFDGNGHPHIVTCSGGRNTGSLNIIRRGAGFDELAVFAGISNVTDIWPIKTRFDESFDSYVLFSTTQDSHLVQFDGASLISLVVPASLSFVLDAPTLALGNILRRCRKEGGRPGYDESSNLVVQVTPKSLILLEYDHSTLEYTQMEIWTPQSLSGLSGFHIEANTQIVAASVNSSQVLMALNGAIIVLLNLSYDNRLQRMSYRHVGDANEVSAVSCIPQDTGQKFSTIAAISFWGSNHIEIYSIRQAELWFLCKTPTLSHVPRSLLLRDFVRGSDLPDRRTHLLAGLGNGTVVSFAVRNRELVDQKTVFLGGAPVCMTALPYEVDGTPAVFAAGSKASIFYWDRNRLQNNPVVFKDIVAASPLSTYNFPDCVIMATADGLVIGKVGELNKLHVRSIPLGLDNPRRIVFDERQNVVGIACTRSEPVRVGEPEVSKSFCKLLDGNTFSELSQFNCAPDEEITALQAVSLSIDDYSSSYLCVGTFSFQADEKEPTEGRLLLFDTQEISDSRGRQLSLVASVEVQGCVYALANPDNMVAAAINASVVIYRLEKSDCDQSAPMLTLKKLTEWRQNYLVRSLGSLGDSLVLGDAMSSVSVLKLVESKLRIVARDYGPLWPVCVQLVDEKTVIGANADMNIFTFVLRESGAQNVLEVAGLYHFADMITKFISATLNSSKTLKNAEVTRQQLFFTSSGCIGIITDVSAPLATQMKDIQQRLATIIEGTHGTSHTKYRAPKYSRGVTNPSSGFLDGDFLEQYMASPSLQNELLLGRGREHLGVTEGDLDHIMEVLQSMH